MDIFLIILAIIMMVGGLIGCVLPALPGPPLVYVGILFAEWSGYADFSVTALVAWGIATIAVSVIDFMLTPWMTKRFGGSRAANRGSIIGLIVGMFLPFPVGILFGPFVGALVGELIFNRAKTGVAMKAALGAFLSFFVGTGIKLMVCIGMIVHTIINTINIGF